MIRTFTYHPFYSSFLMIINYIVIYEKPYGKITMEENLFYYFSHEII